MVESQKILEQYQKEGKTLPGPYKHELQKQLSQVSQAKRSVQNLSGDLIAGAQQYEQEIDIKQGEFEMRYKTNATMDQSPQDFDPINNRTNIAVILSKT